MMLVRYPLLKHAQKLEDWYWERCRVREVRRRTVAHGGLHRCEASGYMKVDHGRNDLEMEQRYLLISSSFDSILLYHGRASQDPEFMLLCGIESTL